MYCYSLLYKNLVAIALFWGSCLCLFLIEVTSGYHTLSGLIFLMSIPMLVGYLAWINRILLHVLETRLQSLLLYSGVVFLTSILVIFIGLFATIQLKHLIG